MFQELPETRSDHTNDHRIIPLNFATKSELMEKSEQEASVQYWLQTKIIQIPVKKDDWIIFNSGLNGGLTFYNIFRTTCMTT